MCAIVGTTHLQNVFNINARGWQKNGRIGNAADLSGATEIQFFCKFDALVMRSDHDQCVINEAILI